MEMTYFRNVGVYRINEDAHRLPQFPGLVAIRVSYNPQGLLLSFIPNEEIGDENVLLETVLEKGTSLLRVGKTGFALSIETLCLVFKLSSDTEASSFQVLTSKALKGGDTSVFAERTEDSSALQYFQFYGYLSQQQNMMQDYVRTSTYQKAILKNEADFIDKVILDVGAGSGILSFFAIQAGAKKVYAVEASSMAMHAEALANNNGLKNRLVVLPGKIEEIELPEKVDAIISEPMGYMLYNERMLETFLHAKKWLKPNGKMFPTTGDLHISPFSDEALFQETCGKANFWNQTNFHSVDLSCLKTAAYNEYFCQPIVDTFDIRICLAKSVKHTVDFLAASEQDLYEINIPFEFEMLEAGVVHGLAFWFDVAFKGSQHTIWLSTAPTELLTHWYQVRCLIKNPIILHKGEMLRGKAVLTANKKQSYDVYIEMDHEGVRRTNKLDLKNPYFRYNGQLPPPPPGHHTSAPSDAIWSTAPVENGHIKGPEYALDQMGNLVEVVSSNPSLIGVLSPPPLNGGHALQEGGGDQWLQNNGGVRVHFGEYVAAAGGQHQGILLNNTNPTVLPASHNIHWSH